MLNRLPHRRNTRGYRAPSGAVRGIAAALVESLESRTLLSGAEAASAQLNLVSTTGTAAKPVYNYNITLTNKGSTGIGTFWLAWVPGYDFLPSVPSSESGPVGWSTNVTGAGNSFDGSAVQWISQTAGSDLAGGKSLSGFDFSSADSPAKLAGKSPILTSTPILTSFVYSGEPFSDPGFQFVVSPVKTATLAASTTKLTTSSASTIFGTSLTFTAKVSPATTGGATPTGSVKFMDGAVTLATVALASGSATFKTSSLSVGSHSIKAIYGGSTVYLTSTGNTVTETINQPPALNATVTADIATIHTDFLKFKSDFTSGSNLLVADAGTIKTDDTKQAAAIAPVITKLDSDVKTIQTALTVDTLADSSLVMSDESTIRGQEVKVIQDKASASLEAADKAKLKMERIKLQTDLLAALTARIAARQTDYNTLFADAAKLITTIGSGSHATTALQNAVNKFTTDKTASSKSLTTDLTKLGSDRTKITADLTAEQST